MVTAIDANAVRSEPVSGRQFTWKDEADLSWFFSAGLSAFEKSTFGAMVERLEQFGEDGEGKRIETPEHKSMQAWEFMSRRLACRKARYIPQQLADELRALIAWDELDPRLTAIPKSTASKFGQEQGYTPDHATLMRFAGVSRRLSRIPPTHRKALELYFGLEGARWIGMRAGQIMILFSETHSGKRLLARFGRNDDGAPVERVAAIWARNTGVKGPECSGLIRSAETEAFRLLAAAKSAYSETA